MDYKFGPQIVPDNSNGLFSDLIGSFNGQVVGIMGKNFQLGFKDNTKVRDYANDSNVIYENNFDHIRSLVQNYVKGPDAINNYYNNSSRYLYENIQSFLGIEKENRIFRINNFSPVTDNQYEKLKELQRRRLNLRGQD